MVPFTYATAHLSAVWRLAFASKQSPDTWRDMIDRSVDGVFKSFWAIVYAAPFAALSFISMHRLAPQLDETFRSPLFEAPFTVAFITLFLTYVLTWAVSIIAVTFVAQRAGFARHVSDLVICYNWSQVIIVALQAAPITLVALSPAIAPIGTILAFVSLFVVFILFWRVFRRVLGAGAGLTIALLGLLLIINVIIGNLVTALGLMIF